MKPFIIGVSDRGRGHDDSFRSALHSRGDNRISPGPVRKRFKISGAYERPAAASLGSTNCLHHFAGFSTLVTSQFSEALCDL